jgi:glutamate-5-semialdehyde dehydrogenase
MSAVLAAARRARSAAAGLAGLSSQKRNAALEAVAAGLERASATIVEANAHDLAAAQALVQRGEMSQALFARLKLSDAKVHDMVAGVRQVAALPDPVGKVTLATELDEGLRLYRVSCPIGVVGVIFEARPDALVQIAALCLKSGDAVLLKGGREAERSNRCLFDIVSQAASGQGIPEGAFALLESREDVAELLKADGLVDLIIPRGSNALVRHIQQNTTIPVLGHADGICHIYVDKAADLAKAQRITLDAKLQYPAVCNALETLLVHRDVAPAFLPGLAKDLGARNVEVRVDKDAVERLALQGVKLASENDWRTEYCDLILSIRVVDSLDDAITHINTYGSRHTDAIVTEDQSAWQRFFAEVDSAGVFLNASTRFSDGFRYGFGAEVGISTGKLHPRGPVGLEGMVTYKYKLVGDGHIVGDYSGTGARALSHRALDADTTARDK